MSSEIPDKPESIPEVVDGEVDVVSQENTAISPTVELSDVNEPGGREERLGRLHPLSLVFEVTSHVRTLIVPTVIAVFSAANNNRTGLFIAAAIFIPTLARSIIRYLSLRYRIKNRELVVSEGIFFQRNRTVPVERIQNIDLIQNVMHRMFGVAEVRIETASGTDAEATLRVLRVADVEKLREAIFISREMNLAEQTVSTNVQELSETVSTANDESLLRIPTNLLIRAGLASNRGTLLLGVLAGIYFQFDDQIDKYLAKFDIDKFTEIVTDQASPAEIVFLSIVAAMVVLLFFRLLGVFWYLLRFHGYQLSRTGSDLRIRCGLLTKVSATVPRKRIQFISIHRNLIMRWMKLASIRIETAGGSGKGSEDAAKTVSSRWFIPVIQESKVAELIQQLRPELQWTENDYDWRPISPLAPRRMARLAVFGSVLIAAVGMGVTRPWGWAFGVAAMPVLVFLAIKKSKSKRYARTRDCVIYRSGIFTKKTSVTFFEKIQTVRVDETPFDRRWKMASLCIDTAAAGPADHRIHIDYLTSDFARQEYDEIVKQAAGHQPVFG